MLLAPWLAPSTVAVCVWVCRCCHQSGGTDVADLPDVLLPEAQYLDMFDSESDSSGDCLMRNWLLS